MSHERLAFLAAVLLLPFLRGDRLGAAQARGEVQAATSTTTTRKLIDTDLASVITTSGQLKLIRTADNTWTSATATACPDGINYPGGAYSKCFSSASAYTQQCTGSNYCGSNTSWDSSTSKCVPTYTQCSGVNVDSTVYTNNNSCPCTAGWYEAKRGTGRTAVGGACRYRFINNKWWYETGWSGPWANRADANCPSGYHIPTNTELLSAISATAYYTNYSTVTSSEWGGGGAWWSNTEYDSSYAYNLHVSSSGSYVHGHDRYKTTSTFVRCLEN